MTAGGVPPSDYRLLVPRDWFRIDLTQERWRRQLKTFVTKESHGKGGADGAARGIWTTLRNTAENGRTRGALEFYLKTESSDLAALPASLLVSLALSPPALVPQPDDFAQALAHRMDPGAKVDVAETAAGKAVRAITRTTMDFHVQVPGGVGYLHLAYSVPLSGTDSPMGDLCDAIAHSLRWV
ncbi:hypothetical protein [Streptomyces tsukubensis]|uniref:Uncharacterized protein n=1 Tax=Streptomyces tsukubensis TaxID=83656 RepID=A0A1V4ABP7_9ACTN|nr:hypothetical protein [Streptomyces tsukubensis]OON80801.1 hypothetical protein B1H18_10405 [Streptomyces tsukubensis]QFR93559.1 hypothetical protein GBW32_11260 [Streptomyces tsukubensis]